MACSHDLTAAGLQLPGRIKRDLARRSQCSAEKIVNAPNVPEALLSQGSMVASMRYRVGVTDPTSPTQRRSARLGV